MKIMEILSTNQHPPQSRKWICDFFFRLLFLWALGCVFWNGSLFGVGGRPLTGVSGCETLLPGYFATRRSGPIVVHCSISAGNTDVKWLRVAMAVSVFFFPPRLLLPPHYNAGLCPDCLLRVQPNFHWSSAT